MPIRESETNTSRSRAEASFIKEERAKEGAKAMLEYQANGREIRENMAKLRALRLAKEAADKEAKEAKKALAVNDKPATTRKTAGRKKA